MPIHEQPKPQTKTGCVLMILFLLGTILVGYGAVRLVYWFMGAPMPSG